MNDDLLELIKMKVEDLKAEYERLEEVRMFRISYCRGLQNIYDAIKSNAECDFLGLDYCPDLNKLMNYMQGDVKEIEKRQVLLKAILDLKKGGDL